MVTVPEATKKIVMRSRYLVEAMSKGIINNSSLARYVKPEIEEMLLKEVSNSAIIMALQRMSSQIKPKYFKENIFKTPPQIIIHSNLSKSDSEIKEIIEDFAREGIKLGSLSSITIELPREAARTPGILYFFLKSLSWEGINIINITSSFKKIKLILEGKDTNRAFGVIQSLFSEII